MIQSTGLHQQNTEPLSSLKLTEHVFQTKEMAYQFQTVRTHFEVAMFVL